MDRSAVEAFAVLGAQTAKTLWGEDVVIGGVSYTAAVGLPPFEGRLEAGGEIFSGELLIGVAKADMEIAPALQTEVTARGQDWVITRVTGDGPMAAWNLRCSPRN